MKEISINGLAIRCTWKNVKNLNIRVTASEVTASVPSRMSELQLMSFLYSKESWIREKQAGFRQKQSAPVEYADGEEHFVWGEKCRIVLQPVADSKWRFSELRGNQIILGIHEADGAEQRAKLFHALMLRLLKPALTEASARAERAAGVRPDRYSIKEMSSRWGSCTPSRRHISINLRLVHYPGQCLYCILIHELTHFYDLHHDAAFYALMDRFDPGWREADRILKGPVLR